MPEVVAVTRAEDQERQRQAARVLLDALDVFQAATEDVSPELVIPRVRAVVDRLDEPRLRAVAVALAVEAVWKMPLALVEPHYAGNIRRRLRQVRSWITRVRLEAGWVAS